MSLRISTSADFAVLVVLLSPKISKAICRLLAPEELRVEAGITRFAETTVSAGASVAFGVAGCSRFDIGESD